MAIISRTAAEYVNTATIKYAQGFPHVRRLSFEEFPCTIEEANAHLMLLAPGGYIVLGPLTRGPLGGWSNIRFTQKPISTWIANHRTLHIAFVAKESEHG